MGMNEVVYTRRSWCFLHLTFGLALAWKVEDAVSEKVLV